jgi:hypothetical protein
MEVYELFRSAHPAPDPAGEHEGDGRAEGGTRDC